MNRDDIRRRHAAWERAAATLAGVRIRELRSMTDEEARRIAESLLELIGEAPPKEGVSGLVTQQRLFRRVSH